MRSVSTRGGGGGGLNILPMSSSGSGGGSPRLRRSVRLLRSPLQVLVFLLLLAQVPAVDVVRDDFLAHGIDAIHQALQTLLQMDTGFRRTLRGSKARARGTNREHSISDRTQFRIVSPRLLIREMSHVSLDQPLFLPVLYSSISILGHTLRSFSRLSGEKSFSLQISVSLGANL